MIPRPSRCRAQEVLDRRAAARRRTRCRRRPQARERAQQHADRWPTTPPSPSRSALPRRGEEAEQRAQVGQVEQRQPVLVGVAEDQREALLLRLVRSEDLGQQLRPEVGHRRAHRHAGPMPAEREELDGEAVGVERHAEVGGALRRRARRQRRAGRGPRGRPSRRPRTRAPRRPRAARRSAAASSSCRCRWRRPSARGGSSWSAAPAPRPRAPRRRRARRGRARARGPESRRRAAIA